MTSEGQPIEQLAEEAVHEMRRDLRDNKSWSGSASFPYSSETNELYVGRLLDHGEIDEAVRHVIKSNWRGIKSALTFFEAGYGYSYADKKEPLGSYSRFVAAKTIISLEEAGANRDLVRSQISRQYPTSGYLKAEFGSPSDFKENWDVSEQLIMLVEGMRILKVERDIATMLSRSFGQEHAVRALAMGDVDRLMTLTGDTVKGYLIRNQMEFEIGPYLTFMHKQIELKVDCPHLIRALKRLAIGPMERDFVLKHGLEDRFHFKVDTLMEHFLAARKIEGTENGRRFPVLRNAVLVGPMGEI